MPDTITLRDDVMTAVASLARAQRTLACVVSEVVGLPSPGLGLLRLLTCHGSATIGEIATTLRVDQSVASRQVSALVDRGLVERAVDATDRRVRPLRLTAAGRDVYAQAVAEIQARAAVGFAGWSAADLDAVTALTRRLAEAIERSAVAPGVPGPDRPRPDALPT
ncbi:MAG: MarR family winged helix-turn-helix transcriptional regulator [Micrococcales bacterium]|nr:MarR family winged helix-turn-helix transcriptional regulator [Micrococcales bacterium]